MVQTEARGMCAQEFPVTYLTTDLPGEYPETRTGKPTTNYNETDYNDRFYEAGILRNG